MVFDPKKFGNLGSHIKSGKSYQLFSYLGDVDDKSTITSGGYFNEVKESLRVNDVIQVLNKTVTPSVFYYLVITSVPLSGDVVYSEITFGGLTNPVDTLEWNTAYVPTGLEPVGTRYWNDAKNTTSLVVDGGTLEDGYEGWVYGKNISGSIIANGQPVAITSANGQFTAFSTVDITTPAAYAFIGLATEEIAINGFGRVTRWGEVNDIDTSHLDEGKPVYVASNGLTTKTFPTAPNYIINVGMCDYKHANHGRINVFPAIVQKLADLSDVNGTALTISGQFPVWNNTAKYFDFTSKISDFQPALGFTPENVANKENVTIDTSTTKYPTVNLLKTGLDTKEPTLTKGNLTETTTSSLTITGGTGAVIGSGTTIALPQDIKTTSSPTFADITDNGLTASRAVASDANKKIVSSSTTATELGYVNGVTSAIQTQLDGKEPFHGFVDRSLSSVSVSGLTVTLTKISNYTVYVAGTLIAITANKTIDVPDTTGLHYVAMLPNGNLTVLAGAWDIRSFAAIPVAIVWRVAGTSSRIWDERHGYNRNLEWHHWAHDTIGARYVSGLTGTFATATISVGSGEVDDEDIENTTSGTVTVVTHVYRVTGGVNELYDNTPATSVIKTNGTNPVYDNNGTLSPISLNNYANFYVYMTNDATNKTISTSNTQLYCVVGQGDYATLAAAQAAPNPSFNSAITTAEWKLLYRVIIRRTAGAPAGTYIQADDLRAVSTGPAISGSTGTVTAATVTFSPAGNIAATNVQTAIEELDTEKAALAGATFTGNITQELSSIMKQITTPANPSTGYDKIYFKSDDKLYKLNSAGVEVEVGSGAGGGAGLQDIFLLAGM